MPTKPKPLNPELPTDPRHYGDYCGRCRQLWGEYMGDETACLSVVPHTYDAGAGLWVYRCPMGHTWTCYYAQEDGYFSDCPCSWCYMSRCAAGEKHWPAVPDYNAGSDVYRRLVKAIKDRRPAPLFGDDNPASDGPPEHRLDRSPACRPSGGHSEPL